METLAPNLEAISTRQFCHPPTHPKSKVVCFRGASELGCNQKKTKATYGWLLSSNFKKYTASFGSKKAWKVGFYGLFCCWRTWPSFFFKTCIKHTRFGPTKSQNCLCQHEFGLNIPDLRKCHSACMCLLESLPDVHFPTGESPWAKIANPYHAKAETSHSTPPQCLSLESIENQTNQVAHPLKFNMLHGCFFVSWASETSGDSIPNLEQLPSFSSYDSLHLKKMPI